MILDANSMALGATDVSCAIGLLSTVRKLRMNRVNRIEAHLVRVLRSVSISEGRGDG